MARPPIPATAALPFLERPTPLLAHALGALDGDLRELTGEDMTQAYLDSLEHAHALNRWRTAPDPAWLSGSRADLVNAFYTARLRALAEREPETTTVATSLADVQHAPKATTTCLAFADSYDYKVDRNGLVRERTRDRGRQERENRVAKHVLKLRRLEEYHVAAGTSFAARSTHEVTLGSVKQRLRRLRLLGRWSDVKGLSFGDKALRGLECLSLHQQARSVAVPGDLWRLSTLRELSLSYAEVNVQSLRRRMTALEALSIDQSPTALGRFAVDALPRLRHLSVTMSGLTSIVAPPSLTSIDLSLGGDLGDDGVAALAANLPALRHATLSRCGVGDAGVAAISAGLPQLLTLTLQGSTVTGAGLAPLVALHRLVSLDLAHSANVGRDGCVHLGAMWSLTALDVSHCGIRREGATALQPLHQLADLKMGGPGGGWLSQVVQLTSLTSLSISDQEISVEAAQRLQALPRLYLLHAQRCAVSVEAAEELCKLLRRRPGARAIVDADQEARELFTAARLEVEQLVRSVLVWRRHFVLCLRRGQTAGGVEDPLGARLCRLQEHLVRMVVRFC